MALQTFTSGQVLTAAQLTALQANDYNQTVSAKVASYVLVAADKGTRITMSNASATTITVNTGLFTAGDSLRIQNLNTGGVCTITAGTATVTSAGSLAIPSWGGGQLYFTSTSAAVWFPDAVTATPSGLVYVTGASFSAQSTVSMAAGAFTSTYKNYQVALDITSVSTQLQVSVRVNNAGTPRTGASYFWGAGVMNTAGSYTGTGSGSSATPQIVGADGTRGYGGLITVFDPTNASSYTNVAAAGNGNIAGTNGAIFGGYFYNAAEANDGLTFVTSTGTMTGFYRVYGMSES
jgi:hypothetical protein